LRTVLSLFSLLIILTSATALVAPPEGDPEPNAKRCRCKPKSNPHYPSETYCLAANLISFRPICLEGGGDCDSMNTNCRS